MDSQLILGKKKFNRDYNSRKSAKGDMTLKETTSNLIATFLFSSFTSRQKIANELLLLNISSYKDFFPRGFKGFWTYFQPKHHPLSLALSISLLERYLKIFKKQSKNAVKRKANPKINLENYKKFFLPIIFLTQKKKLNPRMKCSKGSDLQNKMLSRYFISCNQQSNSRYEFSLLQKFLRVFSSF